MVRKDMDHPRPPTRPPTHFPPLCPRPKPGSHRATGTSIPLRWKLHILAPENQSDPRDFEAAITQAVRKRASGCENFVGVIVQRTASKSPSDANWGIKGVRFGGVSRKEAAKTLSMVVARMQQEFSLSED